MTNEEAAAILKDGMAKSTALHEPGGLRVMETMELALAALRSDPGARLAAFASDVRRIAEQRVKFYGEAEMPGAQKAWREIVDYCLGALAPESVPSGRETISAAVDTTRAFVADRKVTGSAVVKYALAQIDVPLPAWEISPRRLEIFGELGRRKAKPSEWFDELRKLALEVGQ